VWWSFEGRQGVVEFHGAGRRGCGHGAGFGGWDGSGPETLGQTSGAGNILLGIGATVGFALMREFFALPGDAFETEESVDEAAIFVVRTILRSEDEGGLTHEVGERRDQVLEINGLLIEDLDELGGELAIGRDRTVIEGETAEGAAVGFQVEAALVARFGDEDNDLVIGVTVAEFEDTLLIFLGKTAQFG